MLLFIFDSHDFYTLSYQKWIRKVRNNIHKLLPPPYTAVGNTPLQKYHIHMTLHGQHQLSVFCGEISSCAAEVIAHIQTEVHF